jgi:large subunit ribosomal protein L9
MKVILMDNVIGLGRAGDIKSVKDGYARNFLLPRKMVEIATKQKEAHLTRIGAKLAEKAKKIYDTALQMKEGLEAKTIEIKSKAGEEGKLFGSITSGDIASMLKDAGFEIDRRKIVSDHIKTLGEHSIKIRLDEGVTAVLKVNVIAE